MPDCGNDHSACARLIDWQRGNPYVWRIDDLEEINIVIKQYDQNKIIRSLYEISFLTPPIKQKQIKNVRT